MKKICSLLILVSAVSLFFTACGLFPGKVKDPTSGITTTADANQGETQGDSQVLSGPIVEWWELYNPNGFDTLTMLITNPNDTAVDFSYDIVFYKANAQIAKFEYGLTTSVRPGGQSIIWVNGEVPSNKDVDDVRLENIGVTPSSYTVVNGTCEYIGTADGIETYEYEFAGPLTVATFWFVQYNDYNQNGRFDKGEIVVCDWKSALDQKGSITYDRTLYNSTNCDVYFSAYKNPYQ